MNNYKLSIYTSLYNISAGIYDWQKSLVNFMDFGDEVCVATTTDCKDNTVKILEEYCAKYEKLKLVVTNINFDDYAFDGKLKNAALQETQHEGKILFDIDEIVVPTQRPIWLELTRQLYEDQYYLRNEIDGYFVPSINLCGSVYTAKDIGYKVYLHKKGLLREVVNYAKLPNGKIDIKFSDTTEPCKNGVLGKFIKFTNNIEDLRSRNDIPYVFHDWAIDFDKRLQKNKWWKPTWENRAGREVNDIIEKREDLQKIKTFEHGLNFL